MRKLFYLFALSCVFYLHAEEKSFYFADLGFTVYEVAQLDKLNIHVSKRHDQFGNLSLLPEELHTFLKEIGNDNEARIETTKQLICKTVRQVVEASSKNSAWVSIRSHLPSNDYDTPRWHMDGSDYDLNTTALYPNSMWKFVTTLKGPATLMYDLPSDLRETFIAHFNDREFLNHFLDIDRAEKANIGQGTFFIVGNKNHGAIHSEPATHESRLFLSIIVGNEEEIQELYKRRCAQSSEEMLWEESYIWQEHADREERERNKPQVGQMIVSPTDSYKVTGQIGETLYTAKATSGKMVVIRWGKKDEHEFLLGQLFDYPSIVKSIEIFPLENSTGSFNVLEFVNGKKLSKSKLTYKEAIRTAKQLINTIQYVYSLNYFYPELHLDQLMLTDEKELKFFNLHGFSDLEEVLEYHCCEYCDCAFDSIEEFKVNYINDIAELCVEILSKANISKETKIANRVKIMTFAWTCQLDFEKGKIAPLENYLDQLIAIIELF